MKTDLNEFCRITKLVCFCWLTCAKNDEYIKKSGNAAPKTRVRIVRGRRCRKIYFQDDERDAYESNDSSEGGRHLGRKVLSELTPLQFALFFSQLLSELLVSPRMKAHIRHSLIDVRSGLIWRIHHVILAVVIVVYCVSFFGGFCFDEFNFRATMLNRAFLMHVFWLQTLLLSQIWLTIVARSLNVEVLRYLNKAISWNMTWFIDELESQRPLSLSLWSLLSILKIL